MFAYYHYLYTSPLGTILISGTERELINVRFLAQPEQEKYQCNKILLPVFRQAFDWLDTYFKGKEPGAIPPVHLEGTPFQLLVWQLLQKIPYGTVMTYKAIANQIVRMTGVAHMSAQAVGNAVGHNPIAIFIPCHRVIGVNGNLTGYGGGIDKKLKLLETEHIDTTFFHRP